MNKETKKLIGGILQIIVQLVITIPILVYFDIQGSTLGMIVAIGIGIIITVVRCLIEIFVLHLYD